MSASRKPVPPPDMGGLTSDWQRLKDLREQDHQKDRKQEESGTGDAMAPGAPDVTNDTSEQTPPARPKSKPGRSRGGRRPPPAAADAVPTTVRFDREEASEIDRFVIQLRDDTGRTQLDKAEVFREVLRLAREHEPTRKALLRRLR